MEGLGPLGPGVRPARGAGRVRGAPRALRRSPRRGGAVSIRPENVDAFARAFAATPTSAWSEEDLRPGHVRRRGPAAQDASDARALRGARAARAVRPRQPRGDAARRELRAARPRDGRRRQAPALPRRRAAARSRSASAASSTASAPTAASTSPSGSRRTTGTDRRAAARRPPDLRRDDGYEGLRDLARRGVPQRRARPAAQGDLRRARPRRGRRPPRQPARVRALPRAARGAGRSRAA